MENKKLRLNNVDCCVCGSTNASLIGKGEDFEYHTSADTFFAMQCDSCNLVYLDPRPAASEFEIIYPPTYHAFDFSKKEFGFVYNIRCRLEARRSLNRCRHLKDDARILDVGCGDGFHLGLLRQYGNKTWKLEGVDLDQKAVKAATKAGLDVHLGRVQDVNLPENSYDMVFMIQTIEHLEDPRQVLKTIFRLLREGGQLIIVTDNTDSIDFNWFKNGHWGGYHFPRHFNLFNRNSLTKLALDVGYDIKDLTTIVSPVNWVYSIHNYLVDHKMPQWLINRFTLKSSFSLFVFTVLDFVLQKFGRGALLQATLQKPL